MVDARKPERIFRIVFVEVCVVNTHPPLVVALLENQYGIHQPLGVIDFFDESNCKQFSEFFLDGFSLFR